MDDQDTKATCQEGFRDEGAVMMHPQHTTLYVGSGGLICIRSDGFVALR